MFLEGGKLEASLKFHPKQLRLQNQMFFINPQFFHHLYSFFLYLSEISVIFHAKILFIKINKTIFNFKNHHFMILKIVKKKC